MLQGRKNIRKGYSGGPRRVVDIGVSVAESRSKMSPEK